MLRAVRRRLLLESCEDRSLPSGLAPNAAPTTSNSPTAHTSATPAKNTDAPTDDDDDDAEYANDAKSATTSEGAEYNTPSPSTERQLEYLTAGPIYYPPSYYPSSPPLPTGPTTPIAAESRVPAASVAPANVVVNVQEVLDVSPPQQPPVIRTVAAPVPVAPQQDDDSGPPAGPPAATENLPPVSDIESPPVGPVSSGIPVLDDLDIHVNLDGWAQAATRLLNGLDAMTSPLDGESPWVRLGYWALAVGTVGVSIELTRQGLRARSPEPEDDLVLPVTR
ncbi:MAG TPA: hypothetical protein VHR66_04195 [Gemmataceae bacterium]|jgi:hypothetical protein|nr:hypothetical protein [Gemmataceae bacterium]